MSATTTTTKKTVRFVDRDDERNTVQVFEPLPTNDISLSWFTEQDCNNSKRAQKQAIFKLRQNGVDRLVEDSFSTPAPDVQKSLYELARHTEGRGLERHISPKHFRERLQQRTVAIQAVMLGQRQARKQGLLLQDVSEQLRELSLQYCCPAKIFARRMGKADEYACYKKTKRTGGRSVTSLSSRAEEKTKKPPSTTTTTTTTTSVPCRSALVSAPSRNCSARQELQKVSSARNLGSALLPAVL